MRNLFAAIRTIMTAKPSDKAVCEAMIAMQINLRTNHNPY